VRLCLMRLVQFRPLPEQQTRLAINESPSLTLRLFLLQPAFAVVAPCVGG
jgi:hypothetical protein